MSRVSIVIPTRNSARTLGACLRSARAQTHDDVEVIVVDNGSTDDTVAIAASLADQVVSWGPERSAQRNRGAALASGSIVVFIDSDMTLEPAVAAEVASTFAGNAHLGALVLPELAHGDGFLASCRGLEKQLYLGDRDVEAARAFRRTALETVGGYNEALTAAEDWDLPDRVEAAGFRVGRIEAVVWHDEGRIDLRSQFHKKRYYGRWIPRYLECRTDARPRRMGHLALVRRPRLLLRRPHLAAGLVALKAVEWAGLALGMADARRPTAVR